MKQPKETEAIMRPSSRGRDRVEGELLDRAVEHINALHRDKTRELVTALGEYILRTFFGGEPGNLRAAGRHATWRALARRDDLKVSHSQLWYSAAIVAQMRLLPEGVAETLPVSHHRRLVAVTDPAVKARLAFKAVTEAMTVKQLETAIAMERTKNGTSRAGRPAIPTHLKALRRLPRLVEPLTKAAVSPDDVQLLGVAQMRTLKEQLDEQIQTLTAASSEITAALKEFPEHG